MPGPIQQTIPRGGSRRFSKRLLVLNCAAGWLFATASLFAQPAVAPIAIPAALSLIAWLYGSYVGVGHLDLRAAVKAVRGEPDHRLGA